MDQTALVALALILSVIVLMGALARLITRRRIPASDGAAESPIAVSTEGMKLCPRCGMGNLWTERRCSACGNGLRG